MPNPTFDEVMSQVKDKIREGCGDMPIDPDALEVVPTRFRDSFQRRLQLNGTWDRDGANVLEAARQLGVIAVSIAKLRHERHITQSIASDATDVVQGECQIGFQEGQWCQ